MNILENIIPADLSSAIFWTLFHSLWISFIVCAILYFILQSVSSRLSAYRYNSAALAYVLIVFCTFGMFLLEYNGVSPVSFSSQSRTDYIIIPLDGTSNNENTESSNFVLDSVNWITSQSSMFVQLWLLGLILLSLRYLMGFNSNKLLKKHSHPLGLEYLKTAKKLAKKLGIRRAFRFRESDFAKSPLTIGWLKPLILLPVGIASSMPFSQVEAIIAHELAHLKRNDYFFNLIQALFDIALYFNPFTRWLTNVIRLEREKCCDEIAVNLTGDNMSLATALASSQEIAMQPAPALSLLGDGKQLLTRIKLLVGEPDEPENHQRNSAIILLATVLCSLTLLAFNNSTSLPMSISGLQSGNSAIDMLQLNSSVGEITGLLNGLVNTEAKSGVAADKPGVISTDPNSLENNLTERYAESFKNLGVDMNDLGKQMDMYNNYMQNHKIVDDNLQLDLNQLSKLQDLDADFDIQEFQLKMNQMNNTLKGLRDQIKGQPQEPQKK